MFPNVLFIPLSFAHGRVATIWRACLECLTEMQAAGIDCDGGSPTFVRPLAGGHAGYDRPENLFINHHICQSPPARGRLWTPTELRRALELLYDQARIDSLWTRTHHREFDLFTRLRPLMQRRRLVPGGVDWLDSQGRISQSFTFERRDPSKNGSLRDAITGTERAADAGSRLQPGEVVMHGA